MQPEKTVAHDSGIENNFKNGFKPKAEAVERDSCFQAKLN